MLFHFTLLNYVRSVYQENYVNNQLFLVENVVKFTLEKYDHLQFIIFEVLLYKVIQH